VTTEEIDQLLTEALAGVFNRDIDVSRPLMRESVKEWDSIKHMELIFAIEAATGLNFNEEQIAAIKSVDDLRRALGDLRAT